MRGLPPGVRRVLAAFLLLAAAARGSAAQGDSVVVPFRFAWPDGTTADVQYQRFSRSVRGTLLDSGTVRWRLRTRVEARGDDRRILLEGLRHAVGGSDSLPRPDSGATIAMLLVDEKGIPKDLRGVDDLVDLVMPTLRGPEKAGTAGARTNAIPRLDATQFSLALGVHWSYLVRFWQGASLTVDREWEMPVGRPLPLAPDSMVPVGAAFGIRSQVACGPGRAPDSCVVLSMVERAAYDTLVPLVRRHLQRTGALAEAPEIEFAAYTRQVEIVTEPASLVPVSVDVNSRLTYTFRDAGDSLMRVDEHTRESLVFDVARPRAPLVAAALAGDERAVRSLARRRGAAEVADEDGRSALYHAASRGHEAIVRRLVDEGADAERAESWARLHGDLVALRTLRAAGALPDRGRVTVDDATAALKAQRYGDAVIVFGALALEEAEPASAHTGLATALLAIREYGFAALAAEAVVARTPCDPVALWVLSVAYDPDAAPGRDSLGRRSREAAERLTTCAPEAPHAWAEAAYWAERAGDGPGAERALANAARLGFYSPAQMALARWRLAHLPTDAVFLARRRADWAAMRTLQAQERLRPDVLVLYPGFLDPAGVAPEALTRFGLPRADASATASAATWSDYGRGMQRVREWRAEHARGAVARPLTFSTFMADEGGEVGWLRPSGGHSEFVRSREGAATVDPRIAWSRFRAAPAEARGSPTHASDPDPMRRAFDARIEVLGAALEVIWEARPQDFDTVPGALVAHDSLLRWAERENEDLAWWEQERLRQTIATDHVTLARLFAELGERERTEGHLDVAARLNPSNVGIFAVRAWLALADGRARVAESHLARGVQVAQTAELDLIEAAVARSKGDAAASLRALRNARWRVEAAIDALTTRLDVSYRIPYLPTAAVAEGAAMRTLRVTDRRDLEAVAQYQIAVAEAMRDDPLSADLALRRALRASSAGAVGCWARNLWDVTEQVSGLKPSAAEWLRGRRSQLPCPAG